jgi:hypothetical protein
MMNAVRNRKPVIRSAAKSGNTPRITASPLTMITAPVSGTVSCGAGAPCCRAMPCMASAAAKCANPEKTNSTPNRMRPIRKTTSIAPAPSSCALWSVSSSDPPEGRSETPPRMWVAAGSCPAAPPWHQGSQAERPEAGDARARPRPALVAHEPAPARSRARQALTGSGCRLGSVRSKATQSPDAAVSAATIATAPP